MTRGQFDTLIVRGRSAFQMNDFRETGTAGIPDGTRRLYTEEGAVFEQVYSLALGGWTTFGAEQHTDTQLTAAQVNALAATNIELAPAPPAGTAIIPVRAHLFMDHGGTDFVQTNGSDHLALRWSGGAELAELGSEAQCTALIEASADAALAVPITIAFVPVAATAIDLDNNGAAEYSTGDGTLSVRLSYVIVPMAAFA